MLDNRFTGPRMNNCEFRSFVKIIHINSHDNYLNIVIVLDF